MGRLVDSGGGSGRRFLSLKDGDKKKVRFVFDGQIKKPDSTIVQGTAMPFSSWWHKINEDKIIGRKYHGWLCIGEFRNCPLCIENAAHTAHIQGKVKNADRKWQLQKKTYVNVWSYADNAMMILAAGKELWESCQGLEGIKGNIDTYDVIIARTGTGFNTKYNAYPDNSTPFVLPQGHYLYDMEAETAASDRPEAELREILSGEFDTKMGSLDQAKLAEGGAPLGRAAGVIVNFGQYAGKTLGQIAAENFAYVAWLASNSHDATVAMAAKELMSANQTPPVAPPAQPAPPAQTYQAPPPAVNPFEAAQAAQAAAGTAPPALTRDALKKQATDIAMSKPEYRDPMKLAGKMKEASGGSMDINSFTEVQLQKLIAIL